MGCVSDYQEPTQRERESVSVLGFLFELGLREDPPDSYGDVNNLDDDTAELCRFCKTHDVSNESLDLQIWWKRHKEADHRREQKEKSDIKQRKLAASGLAKLTPSERKALGIVDIK